MDAGPIADEPERLRDVPKYRAWKKAVKDAGCAIRKVELLKDLNKPDGSLLFALLRTRIEDPQGRPLPAYALLRGHAVLIVTVVINRETGERKFLLMRQRRIGHGGESLEFPAGMLDEDVADPISVAMREMEEETGLKAERDQIFPLCDRPLYTSAGLDDEAIYYFGCEMELPPERIRSLEGGVMGKAEENEYIRLSLWDYENAMPEVDSIQVRYGFVLYFEHLRRRSSRAAP